MHYNEETKTPTPTTSAPTATPTPTPTLTTTLQHPRQPSRPPPPPLIKILQAYYATLRSLSPSLPPRNVPDAEDKLGFVSEL